MIEDVGDPANDLALSASQIALHLGVIMERMLGEHFFGVANQRRYPERIAAVDLAGVLGSFRLFQQYYAAMLRWCLEHKAAFLSVPIILIVVGVTIWVGFERTFGWLPDAVLRSRPVASLDRQFPGLGKEFMPDLDEGSYLWMPTTMTHASIGEALDVLQKQDMAFQQIPEIESVVGKLGRADTPLDPAPISMIETVINYKPEYLERDGERVIGQAS